MSRRQDLQRHRHGLAEIINILSAMKMLSYMETHKLSEFIDAQHRVFDAISHVAHDFLSFYPQPLAEQSEVTPVYLLIGSERGFCGDFNQELITAFEQSLALPPDVKPRLITVGRKLYNLAQDNRYLHAHVNGPNVVEEVPAVLEQTVDILTQLQQQYPLMSLYSIYHSGTEPSIATEKLLPPFQQKPPQAEHFQTPPQLNLSPTDFLLGVAEQYLFAALHELLYTSLAEENRRRIMHLEGAVKHLERKADELAQHCNVLRREEITEEIEVLLLNSSNLDDDSDNRIELL